MNSADQTILYDLFNQYYEKAVAAKDNSEFKEARKLFFLAGEALYKLAQVSDGELKRARIDRADRLTIFAKSLPLEDAKTQQPIHTSVSPVVSARKAEPAQPPSEDEETKFVAAKIPNVSFDDIAGLENVKTVIKQNVIRPYEYPQHYADIKQVRGAILYGSPGTGKTMVAKATAKEVNAVFYAVKGSEIMSKWVGDAEKNVDLLFKEARKNKISVIFFDEFDALGSGRNKDSVVRKSVIAGLLAQIDGFAESENKVLVLAATNLPWDIDSALESRLRMIYIPLPDYEARKYIIKNAYKNFPSNFDISALATKLTNWSGRTIADFCEESKRLAAERAITENKLAEDRLVTQEEIDKCFKIMPSAIRQEDISKYEKFNASRIVKD